jgi:hypothetical protein
MENILMRLGSQARHLASFDASDPCPCCFGALDRLKRAMGEVSRALAQPRSRALDERLEPALDAVRAEGRIVFTVLKSSLQGLSGAPDVSAFRAAITVAEQAINGSASALEGSDGRALLALGASFRELGEALAMLTGELQDNLDEAKCRGARPISCEFVDNQQKTVDL